MGVGAKAGNVRVLTFGIGKHCNWYFLKQLSLQTRCWSNGTLDVNMIQKKMGTLLERAQTPVLRDITVEFPQNSVGNLELVPERIPDLFVGGPLVIAGQYDGQFSQLQLSGYLPDGSAYKLPIYVTPNASNIPVSKVFVKNQLDGLIANEWLTSDENT